LSYTDNSTLLKQTYYGTGDNKLDVDIYGLQMGDNTIYTTMAHADCTPIAVSAYGSNGDSMYRTRSLVLSVCYIRVDVINIIWT